MREKLIELLKESGVAFPISTANFLIANGVTLDNQVSSSKWIPVSERLPDAGTNVLVFCKGCDYSSILTFRHDRYGNLEFMYQDDCGYWRKAFRTEVTHWMPLPEPPKGE